MNALQVFHVLSGGIIVASLLVGLFFWRFWRRTHDRLFVFFAVAFWALACERVLLVILRSLTEVSPLVYLVRLFAFALIAIAMLDKNRTSRR